MAAVAAAHRCDRRMRSSGSSTPSPTTRTRTAAARVPEEIWPGYADSWASKKRATLGSALVLTAPGIPMLFQGQELIEGSWFSDEASRRLGPPAPTRRACSSSTAT